MFGLGPTELLIVLLVFFMLFGAKRLPEMARSVGEGMKEFKKATREAMADDEPVATHVVQEAPRRMEAPADSHAATTTTTNTNTPA